ncbi:hypothetical protein C8R43DRAFT_958890 [Mycena crocata]|nr:hypothetical protein C8R43DRAFT_958890 [Mycena crocata]
MDTLYRLTSERAILNKYAARCRSLFAPIRRLPTEILAEIFALCSPRPERQYDSGRDSMDWAETLERVAQSHLLELSQVCSSWYNTVMGVPSLWSTIEADFTTLDYWYPEHHETFMRLLKLSVERSAGCPLTVSVHADASWAGPGLALLADHSNRWRSTDFFLRESMFEHLSSAKGDLPLLQRLHLGGMGLSRLSVFEIVPTLTRVAFGDLEEITSAIPWNQLESVSVNNGELTTDALGIMRPLSQRCSVSFRNLWFTHRALERPVFAPVHSDLRALNLAICDVRDPEHRRQTLGDIFASLTLPFLVDLCVQSSMASITLPMFWPSAQIAAFFLRSSCGVTLTRLYIYNMVITSDELVACLLLLPALTHLCVEDVPSWAPNTPDHILITDGLLRQLTGTSTTPLIPNLTFFEFSSLLAFDDHVLLDFVLSRVEHGRDEDGPFTMSIVWHTRTPEEHQLDGVVTERLSELSLEGKFAWFFHAAWEE